MQFNTNPSKVFSIVVKFRPFDNKIHYYKDNYWQFGNFFATLTDANKEEMK